jgi:hypothetical protein
MTDATLQTLQQTRKALEEGLEELQLSRAALLATNCSLELHQEVVNRIKALKESYEQQLKDFSVPLPDGRLLLRPQYEALEKFAANNDIHVLHLLSAKAPWGFKRVTIKGPVIVECAFQDYGLMTLEGLEAIWSIREVNLRGNQRLNSLKGIPTKEIEEIYAGVCDLTGDLSELSGADKLKKIDVHRNGRLTSLQGIPTPAIEEIAAHRCGLTGDLSELRGADKLKKLNVAWNQSLTSLNGIPTQAIEVIYARECGLTGDQTFLSKAQNLKELLVAENTALTLDQTKFNIKVFIDL